MVKALDLRSNGHMSAWVRTPLLVDAFFPFKYFTYTFTYQSHRAHHALDSRIPSSGGEGYNSHYAQLRFPRAGYHGAGWAWGAVPARFPPRASPGPESAALTAPGSQEEPRLRTRASGRTAGLCSPASGGQEAKAGRW